MDRLNNILYYGIIIAVAAAAAFFFHSYMLALSAAGMLVLPFVSYMLMRLSHGTRIDLGCSKTLVTRNEPGVISVTVRNKSIVPIANYMFKLEISNSYSDKPQVRYINLSVPALGKRTAEISFKPVLCGRISLTACDAYVRDMFSFFEKDKKDSAKFMFSVMPRRIGTVSGKYLSENVSDESSKPKKDSAGTEVVDIREYAPGDSLKTIHWKLSAKKDDLFVREKGDTVLDRPLLLFELCKNDINGILDTVYTCLDRCLSSGMPVKVCWSGRGSEQLYMTDLNKQSDIPHLFDKIYSAIPTNEQSRTLSIAKRQLSGGSVMYVASSAEGVKVVNL